MISVVVRIGLGRSGVSKAWIVDDELWKLIELVLPSSFWTLNIGRRRRGSLLPSERPASA
ncbi:hypothetical protein [Actinoplanes sp. NPDC026619]|uniref:hypothetical protein n=1 Tax=Actinoplanes sp. NPDC026619 TaxID=3155798 RepID=UPI0033DDF2F6